MTKIISLKKRSLYLIGSLIALVASYVIADSTHSTNSSTSSLSVSEVFADVPSGGSSTGDDSGDGN